MYCTCGPATPPSTPPELKTNYVRQFGLAAYKQESLGQR